MSNKKAQLEITGNATGIERTFGKVKQSGIDMAKSVTQSGQDAAKGLDGIGDGAEKGAGKVDKATGNIIASIQRANAVAEAGAKGTAKYYEALANVRGADMAAIKPHLDAMRAIEAAQGTVGISAKQTAAAMRGVPAQFTDIVTSLQGGQAPLTVFLQQGGQLKDMFGGAGNAARALGGYVLALANPFTVAAAAVGILGLAYFQGRKEFDAYNKALLLSGNVAGTSVGELNAMAASMSKLGVTQGAAAEALAVFAQSSDVGKASLQEFGYSALKFSKVTGQSIGDVAKQYAELAKDPLAASTKFNESMNYLTASIYKQVKALQEQGKTTEAAAVAQKAFADAGVGIEKNYTQGLGTLERSWNVVTAAIAGAWSAAKGVGRVTGPEGQLAAVQASLADRRQSLAEYGSRGGVFGKTTAEQIKDLQQQETILQAQVNKIKESAALRAEEAKQVKALTDYDALTKVNLSDQKRMLQEIEQIRNKGLAAKVAEKDIEEQVALVRARYAQKNLGGENEVAAIRAKIEASKDYLERLKDLNLESPKLTEAESQALKIQKELQGSITGVARAQKEKALAAAQELVTQEKLVVTTELWRTAVIKAREEAEKNLQSVFDSADAIDKQAQSQEAANAVFGKGATAIQQMTLRQLQLDRVLEMDSVGDESNRFIKALDRKIDAQKRFVNSLLAADYKTLNAGLDEWLRNSNEAGKLYADEARLAGLTSLERAKVVAQRQVELQLATKLKDIDQSSVNEADKETLRQKARDTAAVASATATAKAVQDEWTKVADQINQSLTDALMRGFESGKGFLQNMVDTIKNLFKTMVLRPVVQAVVSPMSAALTSAMGFSGAANAASAASGGGALSTAGSFAGLAGSASLFGSGISSGLSAWGAGGSVTGLLGSGSSLFAGGVANGLGVVAGALGPIVLGVMALKALMDMDDSGTMHTGGLGSYSARSGASAGDVVKGQGLSFNLSSNDYLRSTEQASVQLAQSVVGMLDSTAKSFGQQAGYWAATGFADDTSKDGAWGALAIKMGDTLLKDWKDGADKWPGREFANGEAGAKEYTLAVAQDVRDVLLTQTPDWADTMLNALGDAPSIEALATTVAQINGIQDAFVRLGKTLPQLAGLSDSAVQGLLTAFGGVDNLSNALGGYYQSFYSEAERTAKAATNVADALTQIGAGTPATIAGFRQLVEAQDLTTEAGRSTYASLIALSPAFAEVTNAADAAAKAIADAAKAVADQRASLQQQLDQAMGNTAAIRARELAALDPSNRALQQRIYLLADEEAAMQASVRNTDAALVAVRKAVDAEKNLHQVRISAAQEQVSTIKGIFDTLDSAIASLLGGAATSAQAGEDFIAQALTAARTTGYLPDQKDLSSAIGAATGGLASRVYTSAAEQQADRLRLAAKLGDLKTVAGDQLSTAEQALKNSQDQLASLESIYTQAQQQVNILRGIDTTAKTIPDALAMLGATLTAELRAVASAAAAGSASAAAAQASAAARQPYSVNDTPAQRQAKVETQTGVKLSASDTALVAAAKMLYQSINGGASTAQYNAAAAAVGGDIGRAVGWDGSREGAENLRKIYGFAKGGYYPGGMALVGEDGPEVINFDRPGQVYTAAQSANLMGGNTQRLESLVEGLTQQVVYLREQNDALVRDARRTADATNGNPERPVLVEIAT